MERKWQKYLQNFENIAPIRNFEEGESSGRVTQNLEESCFVHQDVSEHQHTSIAPNEDALKNSTKILETPRN